MKTITKFFAATILLLSLAISAFAYDFSAVSNGKTLYYNITSSSSPYQVEVTYQTEPQGNSSSYSSLSGSLTIPSSVTYSGRTYSVTSIGEATFYYCSGLTSVTIPNSVSSIGRFAFNNCSGLTYVTIPNSVTSIGEWAFQACSGLTSVTIPNSVTSIGNGAFNLCSGLTSVTIPNSVTSIGGGAFNGCSGLTSPVYNANCFAYFPCGYATTYTIPNGIQQIAGGAFSGCSGLTSVTIPNSVTSIGLSAFSGCSGLTSVTIPNSVTSIGNYAFSGCNGLTGALTIPNSVTSIGEWAFYNCSGLTTINFNATNCTSMGGYNDSYGEYRYTFENCTSLSTLNIGENVTNIPANAFSGCSGLTSVTIPNSVTSIGDRAFYNCSGLTSVNFNATNCTTMGSDNPAFYGCTSLATLNIGENVTNIPNYAFYGCSGLTTVNFNATNCTTMGSSVWRGCSSLSTLNIGENVTNIPANAFSGCNGLTGALTIPNSVTSIGDRAFYNCSGLTSVTVGSGVSNIGQNAFYNCSGLTTVNFNATNCTTMGSSVWSGCSSLSTLNIGENVTNIPANAFSGCNGMTGALTIPNSVTSIGESAFYGCSGLSGTLTVPNSVASIGNSAFYNCSGLTTVTVGSGVSNIGQDAFYNCSGLTRVVYTGSIAQWCGISFGNISAQPLSYAHNLYINSSLVTNLVIPNTVEEIKAYAFYNANSLTSVTIPNSVTSIGASAFYNCSGVTTVNFNATNCTSMGSSSYPVFQNCNANATINIGEGVTTIPDYAFYGLLGNGIMIIPSSVTSIGNSAFSGCSGMTGALTIPNSVTSIGESAFYGCGGLSGTLTVPNSVASIGNSAFSGCNGLTTLNFNAENCTGTIDYLFNSNNTLSKITIGENVATIPNNAFKNCISLDSIISAATNPPVIYASTFDSQLSLNTPVVVPCGMVEEYEDADFWYNFRHIQQRADCGATYTIIVMSSNSAWGTVSGGGTYMVGETATLTATPNSGYIFSNWSDGSTENPHDVVVMADATYIATFVQGGSSNPTVYNSIEATACGSYTWNDHTYTESGEYQQTFTAVNSADSIVTLTLTINPAPQPQITLYGELDACNPSSVAFATEQYQSYQWSNGATTMITSTNEPGYYYVEVTGENGCTGISEQVCIGVSNAITEAPQISVVGMNSENRNVVAWSALDNANVNAYRIYRENNVANVYEPMATVEALQTTWTDSTADPTARAYRYKVTAVDECGGESPMSDYHKTMHLTINQGLGNTWNLIWSHYEGFNFGTYRIYRGTSPSNMTMIGEVPSNLNSYTDNTATDNTGFYYQVEVVRNTRSRDAEISSRSNIVDNGIFLEYTITVMSANPNRGTVTGGGTYPEGTVITIEAIANEGFEFASWNDENTDNPRQITVTADATYIASFDPATGIEETSAFEIALFPNPANDILNITSSETISEIEIVNTLGQVVKRIEVNSDKAVCDVEELKAGVYVVRIRTTKSDTSTTLSVRSFVKE